MLFRFPLLSLPLLFFSFTNVLEIDTIENYVFEPNSDPYGRTYGEWESKFWGIACES